jgi:ADP-heptose:LPS heptosyltransferase
MERIDGVREIAIVRANALGDFLFALPALAALRHAYPDAHLTWLGRAWHAAFLDGRPGVVDECVAIPPVRGVTADAGCDEDPGLIEAFFARMRERRFDVALQLHGGGRYANRFVKQLGAGCSAGLKAPEAEPLDRCMPYQRLQNERLRLLEAVALVGAPAAGLNPRLPLTARDFEELAAQARGADGMRADEARPLVVLQPGARDPRRRWPPARFAAVADVLAAQGAVIAINATEDERIATAAVLRHMRTRAVDLTGMLSLRALAALISRASLVVSNDTGPLHLAHALATPAVGIYWLSNLLVSSPLEWGRSRQAVSSCVHCPVCGVANVTERCAHDVSFVADVSVEEVTRLALELFPSRRAIRRKAAATPAPALP